MYVETKIIINRESDMRKCALFYVYNFALSILFHISFCFFFFNNLLCLIRGLTVCSSVTELQAVERFV